MFTEKQICLQYTISLFLQHAYNNLGTSEQAFIY